MTFETLFLVLSILGIADAGYLTYKHNRKQPLICPIGDDCSAVTESKWGRIFGVRNESLGLLYYGGLFASMFGALFAPGFSQYVLAYLPWLVGSGTLFSLFLVFVQAFVIKKYCFYCLVSAGISILLLLTSIRLFL